MLLFGLAPFCGVLEGNLEVCALFQGPLGAEQVLAIRPVAVQDMAEASSSTLNLAHELSLGRFCGDKNGQRVKRRRISVERLWL